jgi:hypothetical protein
VSPAYGYVSLALVKHINEGGPGPRYNMKEDPGSSTLIMLVYFQGASTFSKRFNIFKAL